MAANGRPASGGTAADTGAEILELYRRLLLARTPAERLKMGCDMFDSARALVRAGLTWRGVRSSLAMKIGLLLRTYGRDLDAATVDQITLRITKAAERSASSSSDLAIAREFHDRLAECYDVRRSEGR